MGFGMTSNSAANRRPPIAFARLLTAAAFLCAFLSASGFAALSQNSPAASKNTAETEKALPGVEIVPHGGYPELRVDGQPFFIHSAAFYYYRIPRDQWETLLERYRSLGINTIDIYIPWNWHEPREGQFDFDGHTNPRRNLRALLAIIAQKHLRLIARPGPEILNEWRHGGIPDWLLSDPEFKMNPEDLIEGRYAPLDGLSAHDSEAAAQAWLANASYMNAAHAWFAAVARELAPFSSHRMVTSPTDIPDSLPVGHSGPLLFVQIGDDFAINRTNRVGPNFWKFVESLRADLQNGGLDLPVFINPTDMRVSAAGSSLTPPVGAMGQWYLRPGENASGGMQRLTARDALEIQFFTEELKTQPDFPPVMIEYQAGWYTPGDDDRPANSLPSNTLLSSRLLIANGIHGINYFPLQDTYTPAGFSVPWANRSYRWNAALGPDGDENPRLRAVLRNSQFLDRWGALLAACHKRADFGILYTLGAFPQDRLSAADIEHVSDTAMRIERLATLGMYSSELLDPQYQPLEQLLRDPLLLLPVFDPAQAQFQLSEEAQQKIVDYVRRGGSLVVFPARPAGKIIGELWEKAPEGAEAAPDSTSAIRRQWKFGQGEVIESSKDFYSWLGLEKSFVENHAQPESEYAIAALREFLWAARLRPILQISGKTTHAGNMIADELVSNEGSGALGERQGGQGFLSVTNLDDEAAAEATLDVLSPAISARGKTDDYTGLHVIVPPHESLLLPLNIPLCFEEPANPPCGDSVRASGAEFVDAQREDRTLEPTFYTPARAEVIFHLAQQPAHVSLDNYTPDSYWSTESNELHVTLPRGPAPNYLRTLKISMPYNPHVPKHEKAAKPTPSQLTFSVWNAVTFPTSTSEFLRTYPPLIVLDPAHASNLVLSAINRNPDYPRDIDVSVDGPLHGSDTYFVAPHAGEVERIRLKPTEKDAQALAAPAGGLFHGTIIIKSGRDHRTLPVTFLEPSSTGTTHYRYDMDRDGADEWILENSQLRLIVSPESGGRALALVDKSSGDTLSTSVGLFRDNFSYTEDAAAPGAARARGRYGLFNRPYSPEWQEEAKEPALALRYHAPDIFPAGADIEKTIRFAAPDTLRVDYAISLDAAKNEGAPAAGASPPQSFVAVNSFPASAAPGRSTQFCWAGKSAPGATSVPAATAPPNAVAEPAKSNQDLQCQDFIPGGKSIEVPAGIRSVEIESAGEAPMAIEWDCGKTCAQMTIEPKNFSALFRLQFPPLTPGAPAEPYSIRIHKLDLP